MPIATVLMPVYNAEKYIQEALDSVLMQSFKDFDVLVINDGSTDDSEKIILSNRDSRIRYEKNEHNLGLIKTLNRGIDLIDTRYIIRMDADDISLLDRFETQIKFMESKPDVGVLSANIELFGKKKGIWEYPKRHNLIAARLLFNAGIGHAASVFRTSVFKQHQIYYPQEYPHMEDYALWLKLIQVTKFSSIDKVLYKYRHDGQNITEHNRGSYKERSLIFYSKILSDFEIEYTPEELVTHYEISVFKYQPTKKKLKEIRNWLSKIKKWNEMIKKYPVFELAVLCDNLWKRAFYKAAGAGFMKACNYWFMNKRIRKGELLYAIKRQLINWKR